MSASSIMVVEVVMEVRPPMLAELIKGFTETYRWEINLERKCTVVAKIMRQKQRCASELVNYLAH